MNADFINIDALCRCRIKPVPSACAFFPRLTPSNRERTNRECVFTFRAREGRATAGRSPALSLAQTRASMSQGIEGRERDDSLALARFSCAPGKWSNSLGSRLPKEGGTNGGWLASGTKGKYLAGRANKAWCFLGGESAQASTLAQRSDGRASSDGRVNKETISHPQSGGGRRRMSNNEKVVERRSINETKEERVPQRGGC